MAGGSTCVGVQRTSSIEFEPLTLDFRQIQYARDAALYVLNTKSMEEAIKIFTEGLEPVKGVGSKGKAEEEEVEMDKEMGAGEGNSDEEEGDGDRSCWLRKFRDVLTAPF